MDQKIVVSEELLEQLVADHARLGKVLNNAKPDEPVTQVAASPGAVSCNLHVDTEDDEHVTYEFTLFHDGRANNVVGGQFMLDWTDLEPVEVTLPDGGGAFSSKLTQLSQLVDDHKLALGGSLASGGVGKGKRICCRIKCKKTGASPAMVWSDERQPPSRFTDTNSQIVPCCWVD